MSCSRIRSSIPIYYVTSLVVFPHLLYEMLQCARNKQNFRENWSEGDKIIRHIGYQYAYKISLVFPPSLSLSYAPRRATSEIKSSCSEPFTFCRVNFRVIDNAILQSITIFPYTIPQISVLLNRVTRKKTRLAGYKGTARGYLVSIHSTSLLLTVHPSSSSSCLLRW